MFRNANHSQLHFDITPVRILRNIATESDKEIINKQIDIKGTITQKDGTLQKVAGWGTKDQGLEADIKQLEHYLNTNSLNQASLQCTIGKVYDVIIDEEQWIKHQLITEAGCLFIGNLLSDFNNAFKSQHPEAYKKRGITMYISPLNHTTDGGEEGAGGYGNLGDIDAKGLVVFKSNLWDKTTFAHEIAHVAGLEHSFKEKDDLNEKRLTSYNEYIIQVDARINYLLKKKAPKKQIREEWQEYKDDYKDARSKLNVHYRNLHKFKQGKTENFMDYYTTRKTFWKFQWEALQDDIVKFYKS